MREITTVFEFACCVRLAAHLNETMGTDYRAKPSTTEPADCLLVSKTGSFPLREIQVVTIPKDFTLRHDNCNIRDFESNLTAALDTRGCDELWVDVRPTEKTIRYGIDRDSVEQLADLIKKGCAKGIGVDRSELMGEIPPPLRPSVARVQILQSSELEVKIKVLVRTETPEQPDANWIDEAINSKVEKYGGTEAVRELSLVIANLGLLSDEQIETFLRYNPPQSLPFAEIWLLVDSLEIIGLKPRMISTQVIDSQLGKLDPEASLFVARKIIESLRARSAEDKFCDSLREFFRPPWQDARENDVLNSRKDDNEAMLTRVRQLTPRDSTRMIRYLVAVYSREPVEHYFWKAAAAALADNNPNSLV